MTTAGHEAEEVKDVVWTYAGWVVIILICIGAGVFLGYTMWGDASTVKAELAQTTEMVNTLKNERETLKTQLAVNQRDKDACQKQLAAGAGGAQ